MRTGLRPIQTAQKRSMEKERGRTPPRHRRDPRGLTPLSDYLRALWPSTTPRAGRPIETAKQVGDAATKTYRQGVRAGEYVSQPNPPLTRDQVRLLNTDKVVSGMEPTLGDLGVQPRRLEEFFAVFKDMHS